jgi:hypothetical protein
MFLKFIFHPLVKVMFVSNSVVSRLSGAALPQSLEESSKPAASAVGGPFPHTPVAKAVVAGIGCLFVAKRAGLFTQVADMTEAQASPAPTSAREVAPPPTVH